MNLVKLAKKMKVEFVESKDKTSIGFNSKDNIGMMFSSEDPSLYHIYFNNNIEKKIEIMDKNSKLNEIRNITNIDDCNIISEYDVSDLVLASKCITKNNTRVVLESVLIGENSKIVATDSHILYSNQDMDDFEKFENKYLLNTKMIDILKFLKIDKVEIYKTENIIFYKFDKYVIFQRNSVDAKSYPSVENIIPRYDTRDEIEINNVDQIIKTFKHYKCKYILFYDGYIIGLGDKNVNSYICKVKKEMEDIFLATDLKNLEIASNKNNIIHMRYNKSNKPIIIDNHFLMMPTLPKKNDFNIDDIPTVDLLEKTKRKKKQSNKKLLQIIKQQKEEIEHLKQIIKDNEKII